MCLFIPILLCGAQEFWHPWLLTIQMALVILATQFVEVRKKVELSKHMLVFFFVCAVCPRITPGAVGYMLVFVSKID